MSKTSKRGKPETRKPQGTAPNRGLRPSALLRAASVRCPSFGVGVLLALISLTGCGGDKEAEPTPAVDNSVRQVARGSGVELTLAVDDSRPREDKFARVTVSAEAESGVTVELEDYAAAANTRPFEFSLSETGSQIAQPVEGGKLRWSKQYDVRFFLPGEYELPAASARYVDLRSTAGGPGTPPPGGDAPAQEQKLETEGVKLAVASMSDHEPTQEELAQLPVPAPVELRDEPVLGGRRWPWIAAATVLALVAAGAWWFLRRGRRGGEHVEVVLPAHEWAALELASLIAEDLLAKGQAQAFYYRLSGIVRGYIERRFEVAAEEMTTEEFLVAMARDRRFDGGHRGLLEQFLLACDMVKYALYRPTAAESDEAVAAARNYVEQTRPRPEQDAESPAREERAA